MTGEAALGDCEWFPTPAWCVWRILDTLAETEISRLELKTWLEPCCGDRSIIEAVKSWRSGRLGAAHFLTCDLQFPADHEGDYLAWKLGLHPAACIMNPPFSKALQFAAKAHEECRTVFMLQRLNWLASGQRHQWLSAHTPDVYVLPDRPSFTGDGKTDGQDYAWFVWRKRSSRSYARVEILDRTAQSERGSRATHRRPDRQAKFAFPTGRQTRLFPTDQGRPGGD